MARKLVAVCVAALALLLVSSLWDPADARRNGGGGRGWSGGGGHHHSGRSFSGRSHGHMHRFHSGGHFHGHAHHFHHHRLHRHRHAHLHGVPFVYGYYAYSDGCHWLRQRALYTGSPYWWDRYNSCRYGYNDYYNYD